MRFLKKIIVIIILCIIIDSFFIIISLANYVENAQILYEFHIEEQIDKLKNNRNSDATLNEKGIEILNDLGMYSNDNRIFALTNYEVDGNMYPFLAFSNRKITAENQTGIREDEYLVIDFPNLSSRDNFKNIYLQFDYIVHPKNSDRNAIYTMEFLVTATNGKEEIQKTYKVQDFEFQSCIAVTNADTYINNYGSIYNVKSENLLADLTEDYEITDIKIHPYGDNSMMKTGNFGISNVSIIGSNEETSQENLNKVQLDEEKENDLRNSVVSHMKELMSIDWKTDKEIKSWIPTTTGTTNTQFNYLPNINYKGVPYTPNQVHSTLEAFNALLDNNGYYIGPSSNDYNDKTLYGVACLSSIWDALTSSLTFDYDISTSQTFMFSPDVKLLGNLSWSQTNVNRSTEELKKDLYNEYLKDPQKSELYDIAIQYIHKKWSSNDSRLWYIGADTEETSKKVYYLGYSNVNAKNTADNTGIIDNANLEISIENQNIQVDKDMTIYVDFTYALYENYDKDVKNIMEIYLVSDSKTYGPYKIKNITELEDLAVNPNAGNNTGKLYKVTTQIDMSDMQINEDLIRSIKIMPYGSNSNEKKGGVFRLVNVTVNKEKNQIKEEIYNCDAIDLIDVLELSEEISAARFTPEGVELLNNKLKENELIANVLTAQTLYYAYSELQNGDAIITYPEGIHIRLISGGVNAININGEHVNTSVEEKSLIKASESYVIATESYPVQSDTNSYSGYIDKKYSFSDLYSSVYNGENLGKGIYVPITFEQYKYVMKDKKIELLNGNTAEDIIDGIKGSVYTNSRIRRVDYVITGESKNGKKIEKSFQDYPVGENMNYSLYYSAVKDEVDEYLKQLGDGDYHINIVVTNKSLEGNNELATYNETKILDLDFQVGEKDEQTENNKIEEDDTVSKNILPFAGTEKFIFVLVILFTLIGIASLVRYKNLKDVR